MYSDILSQIHTKDERDQVLSGLSEVKKTIYEPLKRDLTGSVKQNLPMTIAPVLLSKFSSENPERFIEGLENELRNLKVVTISLAFMPTLKTADEIFGWVDSNLGVGIIVDIVVKPDILGGALVDCDGKYFDGSLEKTINDFFRANSNFIDERL